MRLWRSSRPPKTTEFQQIPRNSRLTEHGTGRIAGDLGESKAIDCGKVNVTAIAFDPRSNTTLAAVSTDGVVRIWNTVTRKLLRLLRSGNARGLSVAYSPDGKYLAASYKNNNVQLWSTEDLNADPAILSGHTDQINSLSYSPKSGILATASADKTVRLWDTSTAKQIYSFSGPHLDPIECVSFTPDGNYLASADKSGKVVLWSVIIHRALVSFSPHRKPIYGLSFTSDGNYIATGSEDRTVRFFATDDLTYRTGRLKLLALKGKMGVSVDGEPAQPDKNQTMVLPSGPHEVKITTEDGSNSKIYTAEVLPDGDTTLTIELKSAFGQLFVASSHPADVVLTSSAGTARGAANETIERLKPGHYTIAITPRDTQFAPTTAAVDIVAAEIARVNAVTIAAFGDPSPPPTPDKLQQIRVNPRDGAEMIWIPDGSFTMGRETSASDAKPPRTLSLKGYWIYRNPVTVSQYRKFCAGTVGTDHVHKMPEPPKWGWQGDQPMVFVSWQDAVDYGRWAFGNAKQTYLPSEAQYERAMQGPEAKLFPWGDDFNGGECVNSVKPNKPVGTTAVGTRSPNGYGLFDMAGNVWEWCEDWYDAAIYKRPAGSAPAIGRQRSIRGGAWDVKDPKVFRTDYRGKADPENATSNIGFRCASG